MSARDSIQTFSKPRCRRPSGCAAGPAPLEALDRTTRSRIELGAVFSLLPLSAAIAAVAAARRRSISMRCSRNRSSQAIGTPSISTNRLNDRPPRVILARGYASSAASRSTPCWRAWASTTRPQRVSCGRTRGAAAGALAPGRFVQAKSSADGRLNWLRAYSEATTPPQRQRAVLTVTRDTRRRQASACGIPGHARASC